METPNKNGLHAAKVIYKYIMLLLEPSGVWKVRLTFSNFFLKNRYSISNVYNFQTAYYS